MDIYRLKITFHIKVVLFLCQHKKSDFAEPAIHKYQLVIINKKEENDNINNSQDSLCIKTYQRIIGI